MRNMNSQFRMTALAAALTAAYATAWAQDASVDELIKPSSSVSIGLGQWDKDRPQMGIHDGMRNNNTQLLLDADIRKRDDATGTWQTLWVRDLGLDTREIRGEYLEQGKAGVAVDYRGFSTQAPYTINSTVTGIGSTAQALGVNIPNTAIGSGANYQFGVDRDKFGLGFYKSLAKGIDLKMKFSTEEKSGQRITSNGSAIFVADLIDTTTHRAEATLNYSRDNLHLTGGYIGSWFLNNNGQGFVQGGAATVAAGNRMTQPLDNQAHQGFLSGHYGFSATTRGTFKLAYTRGTQDERLPTANISSNAYANIGTLQGKMDTTLMQLGLSARPLPQLGVVASLRYNDVKDKTPQYATIRSTDNTANIAINSTPYSYRTTVGKLEGTYDLSRGYSATAGVDLEKLDRTVVTSINGAVYNAYVPMRAATDETTYRLQLRKSLSDTLNGSIAYLYGDREGSDYTTSNQVGTLFVSPVNTADRERNKVRVALDWAPTDALGVQFNIETATDKYGNNARSQGLHEGNADLLSLDASYQLSEEWQVGGWYSWNTNDAHFINYQAAARQGIRRQNDTGNALGLSLAGQINAKTKVGAELSWADDKTVFEQSNSDGVATGAIAPNINSRITRIKFHADYAVDKHANVRLDLIHERWNSDDWQWRYTDGKPWQFGTATDGTTVIVTPKQNATFIGARYIFKFQ